MTISERLLHNQLLKTALILLYVKHHNDWLVSDEHSVGFEDGPLCLFDGSIRPVVDVVLEVSQSD